MQDTQKKSSVSLKTTNVDSRKKNMSMPAVNLEEAETRLAIVAEQIYQYNQKSGGQMTYTALSNGTLLIVASLPGHKLGVIEDDSGILPAIDGKAVE